MKLIIQIPCYNEADTLAIALAALPREVPGIDIVEWLIINDGCTDGTVDIALAHGVHYVVRQSRNKGLAKGFMAGLDACIKAGADIIVNTDADNQYCADDIPKLIEPILAGRAEIVVGARPIDKIQHFSPMKKGLQKLGSWVVRQASNTDIPDAPSGFRAISRDAAMRLNVFNEYTYTLETIIQAGQKNMAIVSVPIRTNGDLRPSRLVKSIPSYVRRSILTILRIFVVYKPVQFFYTLGSIPFFLGFLICVRWVTLYMMGTTRTHIPSLVLAAILLLMGFQLFVFGIFADLLSVNRKILEDMQTRLRKAGFDKNAGNPDPE